VIDPRKFLDDLSGRHARLYTSNIDELLVAQAMGNRQAYDDTLDRLGDVIRETQGVATIVGATLVLQNAARAIPREAQLASRRGGEYDEWFLLNFADAPTQTILPRVTFEEAVQDMVDRTPTTIRAAAERTAKEIARLYGKGSGGIPRVAFVRSAEAAVAKRVQALLAEAIEKGIPELDYMADGTLQPGAGKQIVDAVNAIRKRTRPWSEGYARMAFRTNVNTAVTAGRWAQGLDPDIDPILPAVQFLTAGDSDVRKPHKAGHKRIMLRRNPAWNELAPPLDYNCRCSVRDVSLAELRRMGRVTEVRGKVKIREDRPIASWHANSEFRQGARIDLGIGA
jgi:hypothetical protein